MTTPDRSRSILAFAVVAPGLSPVVHRELAGLGLAPEAPAPEGVEFRTDEEGLCVANLGLRTASRILVRIARFKAAHFAELERAAEGVDWGRWVERGRPVSFRVTAAKSRLYHQRAVAERLQRIASGSEQRSEAPGTDAQLFVVRLFRDQCTISVDSSGELLHRRGYRSEGGKAPLRETLAAALLLSVGWDGSRPLLDPFCGSGTIAIEAALIARRLPPGAQRTFALQSWPGFQSGVLEAQRGRLLAGALAAAPAPVLASDRDRGAVELTLANAERAGVGRDLRVQRASVSEIEPLDGPGWVLTNPPYGVRVKGGRDLRDLYDRFGRVLGERFAGWDVGLLGADPTLPSRLGLDLAAGLRTQNGGLPVTLYRGRLP